MARSRRRYISKLTVATPLQYEKYQHATAGTASYTGARTAAASRECRPSAPTVTRVFGDSCTARERTASDPGDAIAVGHYVFDAEPLRNSTPASTAASSIAAGAPAQRAPTTMTSYIRAPQWSDAL